MVKNTVKVSCSGPSPLCWQRYSRHMYEIYDRCQFLPRHAYSNGAVVPSYDVCLSVCP